MAVEALQWFLAAPNGLPGSDGIVARSKQVDEEALPKEEHAFARCALSVSVCMSLRGLSLDVSQVLKQVPSYKDGGLLLSMWLCITLTKGVQSKPLAMISNQTGTFVQEIKKYTDTHGLSPHPDVVLRCLEQ